MKRHKVHNFAAGLELLARSRPAFFLRLLATCSADLQVGAAAGLKPGATSIAEAAD